MQTPTHCLLLRVKENILQNSEREDKKPKLQPFLLNHGVALKNVGVYSDLCFI